MTTHVYVVILALFERKPIELTDIFNHSSLLHFSEDEALLIVAVAFISSNKSSIIWIRGEFHLIKLGRINL